MLVGQLVVSICVGALALAMATVVGFGLLEAALAYALAAPAASLALAARLAWRRGD